MAKIHYNNGIRLNRFYSACGLMLGIAGDWFPATTDWSRVTCKNCLRCRPKEK
jgi:hypothetical protein